MSQPTADPAVSNNVAADRYEIRVDDHLAGVAAYVLSDDRVTFTHTEIDQAFEGQGLASRLAKAALDDVRAHGRTAVPLCPYIAGYIQRHPEYADLVAHS